MKCKKFQKMIVLALYGELSPEDKTTLDNHLARCPICSQYQRETQDLFSLLDEQGPESLPEADWKKCWANIDHRLNERKHPKPGFLHFPRWVYAAATLLIILGAGIIIGRSWFKQTPKTSAALTPTAESSKMPAEMLLAHHLESIKPILIEYANFTPDSSEDRSLLVDEKLVKGLLIQNILLKKVLVEAHPELTPFLDDLDLVLKEISNIDPKDNNRPLMIKDLIQEREILFKTEVMKKI